MTTKARTKECLKCGAVLYERPRDSNSEWDKKSFCSSLCSNSNKETTDIFTRLEKFQIKTEGDGCWGWVGTVEPFGYGKISSRKGRKGSPEKAHRVSYEKTYGEIPAGEQVLHRCDNPGCTNPTHLFLGSQKDNMKDCSAKMRLNQKSFKNLRPGKAGVLGAGPKKENTDGE